MKRIAISAAAFLLMLLMGMGLANPAFAEGASPVAENLELKTYRGVSVGGRLSAYDPDGDAVSAISRLDAKEAREAILAAIGELAPQLREVVLMRVNSDLKFREIADITGLPLGTVLGRMNQASKKLKESLIRKGIANDWNP